MTTPWGFDRHPLRLPSSGKDAEIKIRIFRTQPFTWVPTGSSQTGLANIDEGRLPILLEPGAFRTAWVGTANTEHGISFRSRVFHPLF